MRTKKRLPFYIFGTVLLIALFSSCEEKPDFVGKDLLPSGDDFIVLFDSMEVIHGNAKYGDSIPSGYKEFFLLGSIIDPVFGISKAEIVTTIMSSATSAGFGQNPSPDSVIMKISLGDMVGEGSMPQVLRLYEYNEYISIDTSYYSNMDVSGKYIDRELGSTSISFGDSIIRIRIQDVDFINKFLDAEDSVLTNSDYLQQYVKGFYFKTDAPSDSGGIAKVNFDGEENQLHFYYTNDDTTEQLNQYYTFSSNYNRRINLFSHDYSMAPIRDYLENGSENDSLVFIQTMAGVTSVIRFPEITQWIDSMPVAINEARLIFPMADTNFTGQKSNYFPENLNLYSINANGRYSLLYDELIESSSFGGGYDDVREAYVFTVKVHIQSILRGDIENLDLLLVPSNPAGTVKRAVLNGWSTDPQNRIRLEITYTKL